MTHKAGHIPKDFDFSNIIDFGTLDLPSVNTRSKIPTKKKVHRGFAHARYRQLESGEVPLSSEEQYLFEQNKTIWGEYLYDTR